VTPAERAGYAQLVAYLPNNIVVGTGLNSGAVEHYTGHATVRPAAWSQDEFARFKLALDDEGHALYLLEDGDEMRRFLGQLGKDLALRRIATFTLPGFDGDSQSAEREAVLYAFEN
jgi:hypothetical protein